MAVLRKREDEFKYWKLGGKVKYEVDEKAEEASKRVLSKQYLEKLLKEE